MEKIVGLKEFRNNVATYAARVQRGQSFIVIRRSRPLFKVAPLDTDKGEWETVIDFTKVRKGGVPAEVLLNYLQNGKSRKSAEKAKR